MVRIFICRFNQLGFCKYQDHCFRKHVNVTCENDKCSKLDCELRHPRNCRYFSKYAYCKFGEYCKFKHEELRNSGKDKEIDNLKSEIETLRKDIEEKETAIQNKDDEISKHLEEHNAIRIKIEKENANLKETIEEMKKIEEDLLNKRAEDTLILLDFKERMKIKYLYESDDEESEFESDDEKREKSRELFRKRKEEQKKVKNNCEICDFTGKTPGGLKTHVRKKHS